MKYKAFAIFTFAYLSFAVASIDSNSPRELLIFESGDWVLFKQDFLHNDKVDSTQFLIKHKNTKNKEMTPYYVDVDLWYFYNSETAHKQRLLEYKNQEPDKKIREALFIASLNASVTNKKSVKKELLKKKNKNERDLWLLNNYLK